MKKDTNGYQYISKGDMASHEFLIYGIVRGIKPKSVLEIGIRGGVSTMAICRGLEDGQIICDYSCCDVNSHCKKMQQKTSISLNFYIMPSDELAKNWSKSIDLLFIDGDHEYSQVKRDYENFSKFVSKNGMIFFHDTYPPESRKCKEYSAYKVLEDLKQDKSIEFVTFPYSFGLTVCRKL